jgi:hypothetical protein
VPGLIDTGGPFQVAEPADPPPVAQGSATSPVKSRSTERRTMTTTTPASATPYTPTTPKSWEQVAEATQDLRLLLDWLHEPRVRGLAERITVEGCCARVGCKDWQDMDHILLLLAATGVTSGERWSIDLAIGHTAWFGKHVRLDVVLLGGAK